MPRTYFYTSSITRRVRRRVRRSRSFLFSRPSVSRFSSDALRIGLSAVVGTAVACALASCELATVTIPKTEAGIVVHGVLNTGAPNQVVLVERTLVGSAMIPDTTFDSTDPIVSAGGIPVSGAIV